MSRNIVTDFGADPTGTADSTVAIQNALDVGDGLVIAPAGVYKTSSTLNINYSGIKFIGEGRGATTIISSATGPTIKYLCNAQSSVIGHMLLDKSTVPTTAASGICTLNQFVNLCTFEELEIKNHYNGLELGVTGYSYVSKAMIHENYNDGIHINNTNINGGCQWSINNTLAQTNNGNGLNIVSGTYGMAVGEINNFSTFGNGQSGIRVAGASPINGLRIMGGFLGGDNASELYLDTQAGFTHKIVGMVIEAAGTSGCGRGVSIAPSNNAYGVMITSRNSNVLFSGCIIRSNSLSGIYSQAGVLQVTGCDLCFNGGAGVAYNRNGAYIAAGRLMLSNSVSSGNQYGLLLGNDNHIITNNTLSGNSVAAYYNAVPLVVTKYANNL